MGWVAMRLNVSVGVFGGRVLGRLQGERKGLAVE